jgi:putative flippase GtrA
VSNWRREGALLGRYAVSGVANTAVGVLAIYTLMWLQVSPYLANLLGYAAGLLFSYFNARNYVFRFSGGHGGGSLRYALAFGTCYGLNMAVLAVGLETLRWPAWLAQGAGIGVHTTLMFLLSRYFVFTAQTQDAGPAHR